MKMHLVYHGGMKILLFLAILWGGMHAPLASQEQQQPSAQAPTQTQQDQADNRYYVKNVRLQDMRYHRLGYVIYYRRENGYVHRVFAPFAWFSPAQGGGGGVLYHSNPSNPTMSVFFKNGRPWRLVIRVTPGDYIPSYGVRDGDPPYKDSDFPVGPLHASKEFIF